VDPCSGYIRGVPSSTHSTCDSFSAVHRRRNKSSVPAPSTQWPYSPQEASRISCLLNPKTVSLIAPSSSKNQGASREWSFCPTASRSRSKLWQRLVTSSFFVVAPVCVSIQCSLLLGAGLALLRGREGVPRQVHVGRQRAQRVVPGRGRPGRELLQQPPPRADEDSAARRGWAQADRSSRRATTTTRWPRLPPCDRVPFRGITSDVLLRCKYGSFSVLRVHWFVDAGPVR
jgi:hypothetical protein